MVYSICTENNGIVSSTNTSSELLVNWEYSELLTVEIFFSLGFIEGINYCGWLAGWLFIIIREKKSRGVTKTIMLLVQKTED